MPRGGSRAGRRRQFRRPGGGLPGGLCRKVWMLVRGEGLADKHVALSDRPHRRNAQHRGADAHGDRRARRHAENRLERVRWRQSVTGAETEKPIRNVFLFIGADPATHGSTTAASLLDRHGLRAHRHSVPKDEIRAATPPGETDAAGDRTFRASSRSAMCARARSSASARRSAKAPPSWRSCMPSSLMCRLHRSAAPSGRAGEKVLCVAGGASCSASTPAPAPAQ